MKPISLVNQVDDFTCVYACIAMAAGVPIGEVIRAAGHQKPLPMYEELALLAHFGCFAIPIPYGLNAYDGIVLLTVPSLNKERTLHRVLVDLRNDPLVLDPQQGRPGRQFYSTEDYMERRMPWTEQCMVFRADQVLTAFREQVAVK